MSASNTVPIFCACKSNPPRSAPAPDTSASSSPTTNKQHDYTLDEIDLFAAYVIPVNVWYLIPAVVILKPKRKVGLMLHPVDKLKKNRYRYEHYREAWHLLGKTREELSNTPRRKSR
jgi:hypothetical protein